MLQRINLIPQKPLAIRIKRTTPLILAVLVLFLGSAMYIWSLILDRQLASIERELTQIQERIDLNDSLTTQTQVMAQAVTQLQKEQNTLRLQIDGLSTTIEGKRYFSGILAKIANAMPASLKLEKISFQGNGGTFAGVAAQYRDLPGLVTRLAGDPLFAHVALQELGKVSAYDREMFSFRVVFDLQPRTPPMEKDRENDRRQD